MFIVRSVITFVLIAWHCSVLAVELESTPPNIVIILADDLGYGDLGCYGHPTIRTTRIDRMAAEGLRFTQFYSASPVCSPSRAALLTGRLPIRTGVNDVFFPDSTGGLPASETTLAEALREKGYATACIGKWHLGHRPQFLPTKNGFDYFFGVPYSNDMSPSTGGKATDPPLPLMRNEQTICADPPQAELTEQYTIEAAKWIKQTISNDPTRPFFLYLAHTMPHVPLAASKHFVGRSARGLYGDVVETIDWSVGEILDVLARGHIAERTLVIFTSDNGPWLELGEAGGSAGLLRDGKFSTYEGGMRVPCICWWPGRIRPDVTQALASTLDVLPTAVALAGGLLPTERAYDGHDLSHVLLDGADSPRSEMFYYSSRTLRAVRVGPWKAHFTKPEALIGAGSVAHGVELYQLEHDPAEARDVADCHPEVLADIKRAIKEHVAGVAPAPPQR